MTDFRALCAELVAWAEKTSAHYYSSPGVLIRARAALAEPQPPADGEVAELVEWLQNEADHRDFIGETLLRHAAELLERMADGPAVQSREPASVVEQPSDEELEVIMYSIPWKGYLYRWGRQVMRAALARWGTAAPQPIPVSERLPEAGDCDAQGRCWWWYAPVPEQTYGYWTYEDHAIPERALDEWPAHWLPAHALPLPSGEVE